MNFLHTLLLRKHHDLEKENTNIGTVLNLLYGLNFKRYDRQHTLPQNCDYIIAVSIPKSKLLKSKLHTEIAGIVFKHGQCGAKIIRNLTKKKNKAKSNSNAPNYFVIG